jgi:hypothetical protein
MAIKNTWLVVPGQEFDDASGWRGVAPATHGALRVLVLIRESRGDKPRLGTVHEQYTVGPNDKVEVEQAHERILSSEESITEGVKFSVLSKLCDTLTSKTSAQFGSSSAFMPAKIGQELQASATQELTTGIERTVGTTASFRIEVTDRTRHTITLNGGSETRVASLRRRYWPRYWDIYIHSWEYLEIVYKRNWTLYKIRQEAQRVLPQVLGWPVCRLTFFEPQQNMDIAYGDVPDELTNPETVIVSPLLEPIPTVKPPQLPDLQRGAALAFPGTRAERATAAQRMKPARPAAKKPVAKRPSAKKALAKAATKRPAAKRPAAKRSAGKKPAAKRSAARKPVAKRAH